MELKLLSRYRTGLMAVAILLVGIFHSTLMIENVPILNFIKFNGDIGVDIFFFVSGFGMFYSFEKNTDIKTFYRKRFLRIVPLWFCINLIVQLYNCFIHGFDLKWFLLNMTGLSFFFTGSLYYWYIPGIIVFYLITPFFMKIFKKRVIKSYALVSVAFVVLVMISFVLQNSHFFILIFRIPIYFAGIGIGKLSAREYKLSKNGYIMTGFLFAISSIPLMIIMKYHTVYSFIRYDFKYLCFFVTTLSGCILVSALFNKIQYKGFMEKLIDTLGNSTLAIYLIHEFILARVVYILGKFDINTNSGIINVIVNIAVFVITVLISNVVTKWSNRIR